MTTLDLFTQPFLMPDGTTRPPLVERVPAIYQIPRLLTSEIEEAILIVAAHRWAAERATFNRDHVEALQEYGIHATTPILVLACHLIADALDSAKGNA